MDPAMTFAPDTVQTHLPSPLGLLRLSATPRGLSGLWFAQQHRHAPAAMAWPEVTAQAWPVFQQAERFVHDYFNWTPGQAPARFAGALDLSAGTAFQQAVWQALLRIAPGQVQSYAQLAASIGHPQATRAVGAAIGRNPVSLIVPCHRVLGATGRLTGYAGGLDRKAALLRQEGHPA